MIIRSYQITLLYRPAEPFIFLAFMGATDEGEGEAAPRWNRQALNSLYSRVNAWMRDFGSMASYEHGMKASMEYTTQIQELQVPFYYAFLLANCLLRLVPSILKPLTLAQAQLSIFPQIFSVRNYHIFDYLFLLALVVEALGHVSGFSTSTSFRAPSNYEVAELNLALAYAMKNSLVLHMSMLLI